MQAGNVRRLGCSVLCFVAFVVVGAACHATRFDAFWKGKDMAANAWLR